eukprot:gene20171-22146_t
MIPDDVKNSLKVVYSKKLDYFFNVIKVGKVFKDSVPSLVTGGEDGILRVHRCIISETSNYLSGLENASRKLETKAGPIQTLDLENLTNFNSIDVVSGDSRGMLTIFTNNQILSRRSLLDGNITSVLIDKDSAGNMEILVGSIDGNLLAVSPYTTLSKQKLPDVLNERKQLGNGTSLEITCLHSLRISSSSQPASTNYIIVADNRNSLHFFQSGTLIKTVSVPSTVTCITTGYFLPITSSTTATNEDSTMDNETLSPTKKTRTQARTEDQVAVATMDGRIFIIHAFKCIPYASIGTKLTNIKTIKSSFDDCDTMICTGNFNSVFIYKESVEIAHYTTSDWIHTFDVLSCDDGNRYLFIGCLDSKIEILSLEL